MTHTVNVKVELWDGRTDNFEIDSLGFTDNEAQQIVDIYVKHFEHVSPEFRLDFARRLLRLVNEGKIAVTPTKFSRI